jgi:hypothetical protein
MAIQDDLITHFDRGLRRLRQEIESYPNEETLWSQAGEINNSAGNLCFHLVGNLNHFIGAGIGKTGYMRDRPREFQITAVPREALIKYVEQTRRMIWQVLRKLNDLDRPYPDDFRVESKTVGEELFRLLAHLHYHLGQINYHRRLLATHPKN